MASLQTKLPTITLLTDPQLVAVKAWGVAYPRAEHPTPATFVVAGEAVRWRYLLGKSGDWPTYDQVAAALK